jgi:hypothetical protein
LEFLTRPSPTQTSEFIRKDESSSELEGDPHWADVFGPGNAATTIMHR